MLASVEPVEHHVAEFEHCVVSQIGQMKMPLSLCADVVSVTARDRLKHVP
jgi:hypothetical protein